MPRKKPTTPLVGAERRAKRAARSVVIEAPPMAFVSATAPKAAPQELVQLAYIMRGLYEIPFIEFLTGDFDTVTKAAEAISLAQMLELDRVEIVLSQNTGRAPAGRYRAYFTSTPAPLYADFQIVPDSAGKVRHRLRNE